LNVLADWHHGSLFHSLHLLFEERLGWNLFRPIGTDFFKHGFWRYSTNPQVIKQYLETPDQNPQIVKWWIQWTGEKPVFEDGVYLIPMFEGTHRYVHRAVTFEKFLKLDFDFVVATVYQHERPFHELIRKHKPNAVLIRQLGNPYEAVDFNVCRNILNSTSTQIPQGINNVAYHQEFSLDDFKYEPPREHKTIKNFVNALPTTIDAPLWHEYKEAMPEFMWRMHGIIGEDGFLTEQDKAEAMRDASFIWNLKSQGDGYGFIPHQALACGRPLIVKKHYYKGQLPEALMEDSETCIDLDLDNKQGNIRKIRRFSEPEAHAEMCQKTHRKFKEKVDFDEEFSQIKKFLEQAT